LKLLKGKRFSPVLHARGTQLGRRVAFVSGPVFSHEGAAGRGGGRVTGCTSREAWVSVSSGSLLYTLRDKTPGKVAGGAHSLRTVRVTDREPYRGPG
jgi:hypothetical protein